jgi:hypothetical protein
MLSAVMARIGRKLQVHRGFGWVLISAVFIQTPTPILVLRRRIPLVGGPSEVFEGFPFMSRDSDFLPEADAIPILAIGIALVGGSLEIDARF